MPIAASRALARRSRVWSRVARPAIRATTRKAGLLSRAGASGVGMESPQQCGASDVPLTYCGRSSRADERRNMLGE
jgi:hypothetical protein